ncbi:MAG TPA: proline iminopeptidase-family hydrolase [Parvularculaceae bacterium]|nr:proline iminopeptidase-family hydrolase [Parvularculaceae bacterium]
MVRMILFAAAVLLSGCASAGVKALSGSGFIDAPGGPVWYEVMGGGDGATLVTLHGGPGSGSCSFQAFAPLGDERAVIRYDQLGTGRSGRPTDTSLWNRDRFVAELDALRDQLGLKEIHLLGHSWGGSLAAYYVLQTGGEGVRSLILSSPLISTPKWIEDANLLRAQLPAEVRAVLDAHERAGTTDSKEYQNASEVFYDRHVTRGAAVENYDCPDAPWNPVIYEQMWGPTEFYATGSLKDFDLTDRLGDIAMPTLFITGEFDEARPETVAAFAKAVPGAQFVVIPGVAHASYTRAPDLYRGIVREFIDGVEQAAENRTDHP